MTLKIIDNITKNEIGDINLHFIPRTKEIIEFNGKTYHCNHIVHSEKGVQILVTKKDVNYDIVW